MILYIVIVFFIILIVYQLLLGFKQSNIEGMTDASGNDISSTDTTTEYTDYNSSESNNCNVVSQQNTSNIMLLKKQIDQLMTTKSTTEQDMTTMQNQVDDMQNQLLNIQTQQQQFITQMQSNSTNTSTTTPTTSSTTTSST